LEKLGQTLFLTSLMGTTALFLPMGKLAVERPIPCMDQTFLTRFRWELCLGLPGRYLTILGKKTSKLSIVYVFRWWRSIKNN
jgi:hypothetical protein